MEVARLLAGPPPRGASLEVASGRGTELWASLPLTGYGEEAIASAIDDLGRSMFLASGVTSITTRRSVVPVLTRAGIHAYQALRRAAALPLRLGLTIFIRGAAGQRPAAPAVGGIRTDTGVQMLTHPAELFLKRVEFEHGDGAAVRLWPVGHSSPIVIDLLVRFGSPTVAGIPTEALVEQVRAGDSVESVADDFRLRLADVISALDYEGLGDTKAA